MIGEDDEEAALTMVGEVLKSGGRLRSFSIGTPHADTGVREIRELISSGKAFAVLNIPISLIPQIARGCSEGYMDEAIAEKVNQMTKIVMASTADALLVHLPGLTRRHEIFTAEQLAQDSANLDDLVTSLQDPEDDCPAGCKDHFLVYCLFTGFKGMSLDRKRDFSLSCLQGIRKVGERKGIYRNSGARPNAGAKRRASPRPSD